MKLLLAFLSVHFILSAAYAQIYNSSITSGTAGSGRAAVDIGAASFLNPATLIHQPNRQILVSQGKDEFAAAVSENDKEALFPASLGYVQRKMDSPIDPVMHDMRLTLAEPFLRTFGFGITGHLYQVKDDVDLYQQPNVDAGFIFTPTNYLGFALVGYDMLGGRKEMPEAYRLSQTTGFGANWLLSPTMRVRGDLLTGPNNNYAKMTRMIGYENYFGKFIIGRVGYQEDVFNGKTYASLGLGLDLPKFDVNYAYFSELPRNATERHSIDLSITF